MDYFKKYLKYKIKYLKLRDIVGAAKSSEKYPVKKVSPKAKSKVANQVLFKLTHKNSKKELEAIFGKYNKSKLRVKKQSVYELSGKIQWLMDFAGMDSFMDLIIDEFTGSKVTRASGNNININTPNTIYFYTKDGNVGHWIYVDKNGHQKQSYTEGHQKPGTNQFCQSFALIYMLNDYDEHDYYNELKSTNTKKYTDLEKYEIWGHNLKVVLSFYMDLILKHFSPEQQAWVISELRKINDDYIAENNAKIASSRTKTISERDRQELIAADSNSINLDLLMEKMADIEFYNVEIARDT